VVWDHLEADATHSVFNKQEVGECACGPAISDDSAWRGHRIDDDVVANHDAGDFGADVDDLARGFVTQWGAPLSWWDAADRDVERVGSADATRSHPDQHVGRADLGLRGVDDLDLAWPSHHGHLHRASLADTRFAASWASCTRDVTSNLL